MKTPFEIAISMPFWNDYKFWEKQLWQQKLHQEGTRSRPHLYLEDQDEIDEYRRWWDGNSRVDYIKWNHMIARVNSCPESNTLRNLADNLAATRYLPSDFGMK